MTTKGKGKGIEAIHLALSDYSNEVREALEEAVTEVTDEAADKLHTAGSFGGKKYRKSWKATVEDKHRHLRCDIQRKALSLNSFT